MLQVNQTEEHGYTVYKFEANNTDYTILKDEGEFYHVYSHRKGLTRATAPKLYTLKEMAARSKALKHLATLIAA